MVLILVARKMPRIGAESMLASVQAAVGAMTWLKPSDGAMVTLALKYAEQIDVATAAEDDRGRLVIAGSSCMVCCVRWVVRRRSVRR